MRLLSERLANLLGEAEDRSMYIVITTEAIEELIRLIEAAEAVVATHEHYPYLFNPDVREAIYRLEQALRPR